MYLRHSVRRKNGKQHTYWRLVRALRRGGKVVQETVVQLGELHAFVRYADDCNVYVRSKRAGERVMQALERMYGELRLRINCDKSKVAPAQKCSFLSYSFWYAKGGAVMCRVAPKATFALKQRVRQITRRNGGRSCVG